MCSTADWREREREKTGIFFFLWNMLAASRSVRLTPDAVCRHRPLTSCRRVCACARVCMRLLVRVEMKCSQWMTSWRSLRAEMKGISCVRAAVRILPPNTDPSEIDRMYWKKNTMTSCFRLSVNWMWVHPELVNVQEWCHCYIQYWCYPSTVFGSSLGVDETVTLFLSVMHQQRGSIGTTIQLSNHNLPLSLSSSNHLLATIFKNTRSLCCYCD